MPIYGPEEKNCPSEIKRAFAVLLVIVLLALAKTLNTLPGFTFTPGVPTANDCDIVTEPVILVLPLTIKLSAEDAVNEVIDLDELIALEAVNA